MVVQVQRPITTSILESNDVVTNVTSKIALPYKVGNNIVIRRRTLPKSNGHNGRTNGFNLRPDETFDRSHLPVPRHSSATMDWMNQMSDRWRGRQPMGVSAYRDHFPEMIFQLRLLGATEKMIANACNVNLATLHKWASDDDNTNIPAIHEAMKRGADIADARVAESLYHRAIGYSHDDVKIVVTKDEGVVAVPIVKHYPPDAAAGIFWLTNRQRGLWRNRVTNEMTGPDGTALSPPQLIVQPVKVRE